MATTPLPNPLPAITDAITTLESDQSADGTAAQAITSDQALLDAANQKVTALQSQVASDTTAKGATAAKVLFDWQVIAAIAAAQIAALTPPAPPSTPPASGS